MRLCVHIDVGLSKSIFDVTGFSFEWRHHPWNNAIKNTLNNFAVLKNWIKSSPQIVSFTSWCGFPCHLIERRLSGVKSLFESIHRLSTTVRRHCHCCLQTHTIKLRHLGKASKISNEHFTARLTVKCVSIISGIYSTSSGWQWGVWPPSV